MAPRGDPELMLQGTPVAYHGDASGSAVPEWIPRPKPGSTRILSPTPDPYTHPRILFTDEDRPEFVQRALGLGGEEGEGGGEGSAVHVGAQAFARVEDWVEKSVYGKEGEAPVRRLLQVLASGRPPPGVPTACPAAPAAAAAAAEGEGGGIHTPSTGTSAATPAPHAGAPTSSEPGRFPEKTASQIFEELCELVTGKGAPGTGEPPQVLYGAFYSSLFAQDLAPSNLQTALGSLPGGARLVKPGDKDTSPEFGVKFLFGTSEGGLPGLTSTVYRAVKEAAYVAWVRGEEDRLTWLGEVLTMAARVHLLWYAVPGDVLVKHVGGPPGYTKGDDSVCQHLALAYDLLYASLSPAQRLGPRRLLLYMGKRRVLTGFDAQAFRYGQPGISHLKTSGTFQVMTSVLLLVQYAVEGESVEAECGEGGDELPAVQYDAEAAHYNAEGIKFWLTHGTAWDPTGTTRECPGYFATAMRPASFPALAAARRGYDIFGGSNLYAALSEIIQTCATWFRSTFCLGGHDGVSFCGGFGQSEYYLLVKYMYPTDPVADWVYQKINTRHDGNIGAWGVNRMPFQTALIGMGVKGESVSGAEMARQAGLPRSFFSNARGMGTARSDWGEEGLLLWFECRPDMYGLGHGHSNRNDFFLAARRRVWISVGQFHNTENEAHATVLIDGVGQGGSHTSCCPEKFARLWSHIPGRVVEAFESPRMTLFAGDASLAYHFVGDGPQGTSYEPPPKMPLELPLSWRDFFTYPPDFGPQLVPGAPGSTSPSTSTSGETHEQAHARWVVDHGWTYSKVHAAGVFNPVEYAFRTVCLVRAPRPYVVVVDDIKKDGGDHRYTWVANTTMPYAGWGWSKPICLLDPSLYGLDSTCEAVFARGEDVEEKEGGGEGEAQKGASTGKVRVPKPGCPLLYLKAVHSAGTPGGPIRVVHVDKGFPAKLDCASSYEYHRIEIERVGCVEPEFKVLLFPFVQGTPLPTMSVTTQRGPGECSRMTLQDSEGGVQVHTDVLQFAREEGGRTRVTLL